MEPCENEAIAAFDTLYTQNHIQILKVLLPYFDPASQKSIAVWIKYMELQYTMVCAKRHPAMVCCETLEKPDIADIFEKIKNFCTPQERAVFGHICSMKKSLEMYEEMKGMMELFEQLSPEQNPFAGIFSETEEPAPRQNTSARDNADAPSSFSTEPMELLKGLLSPEQLSMFEAFSSSFQNTNKH